MATEHWRLIIDPPQDGPLNMAVDELILSAVGAGEQPPTLRLYGWQPACLSLGYGQPATDADRERIAARGWQIVRRATGGRAILHTDELTYSVTLPLAHPLATGSIVDSYRRLSAALLRALQRLGASVDADEKAPGTKLIGPICFEVPSDYEITANGKKLVGSAQMRKQGAALQHGSLPLWGDVARICDALVFVDETVREQAKARVRERAATFADVMGETITWDDAAQAVAGGFAEAFDLAWDKRPLSAAERTRAHELRESRYATEDWTRRM